MELLTSLRSSFKWFVGITLLLSLFVNYRLFNYSIELKQSNQELTQTLEAQQKNNDHLASQIESLKQDKQQAQLAQDEMISQERQARLALERRIIQLKKELAHAPCNHEPIDYPTGWVSGY
ncbi:hypothetical protein HC725_04315 [Vibrio sp. S17_S38]|uniref:hypothetical protein n=1 Tax=Vibrio sp. S17_S38 TaxID=2720229 RepID=UPI0016817859|nr:hypothetical protein [Vibrio sp. S17_S38]MBD1572502.1 hypothetical protein [Vibrio sp. S17_S38]